MTVPDLLAELTKLGEVARTRTLFRRGFSDTTIRGAVDSGTVSRPRRGWIVSSTADRDQLRAIAVGGRIGCLSALGRFGVWSGVDDDLHLQVPRTASRIDPLAAGVGVTTKNQGVWHPSVPERRRRSRSIRLATGTAVDVHWGLELAPDSVLDWIVSPQTALAAALRCMDAEHAAAAIDSVLHERVLTRRAVDAVLASLPGTCRTLVDQFTGVPESGVESLFIRRASDAGFVVEPQVDLAGFGRYDGLIDGCVLFEIDGRGYHSSSDEFFTDRDRSLIGQAFGIPVIRPSARHVLDDWPMVLAVVERVVADAKILRRVRGLPPIATRR